MNNITKLLTVGLCSIMAVGCDASYLDKYPEMQNTTDNFFQNEEQLDLAVIGAYSILQWDGLYNRSMYVIGENPSDNAHDEVPANDSGYSGQLDDFDATSSNDILCDVWKDGYIGIQQCNMVLNRIEGIDIDQSKSSRLTGEMKFLRGLMYFNLVRVFGDVPLVTKETTDPNEYFGQGRTAKSEVYAQIISDLSDAASLLPVDASELGRATKGAAQGILGSVYMAMGNYADAKTQFEAVKSLNKYSLLANIEDVFNPALEGNAEVIFDVQFASGLNGNNEGSDLLRYCTPSGYQAGSKGHCIPTTAVMNLFDESDARKLVYFKEVEGSTHYASGKLAISSTVPEDCPSNYIVLRYADLLLMLAECEVQVGTTANANGYLNEVKSRANVPTVSISDKTTLEEEIALERRKELANEGHRWFDLIRTGKAIEVMNAYFAATPGYAGLTISSKNLVQPIPQSQVDTDPSIKQNEGYI